MRIAGITVISNEWHQLEEWKENFNSYKDALALHIIVDNNSHPDFRKKVTELFPGAVFIARTVNGGVTAAFNDGIKHALKSPEIDTVFLVCPDIKITTADVAAQYQYLQSDAAIGVVGPVLLKRDSADEIECYGGDIDGRLHPKFYNVGAKLNDPTLPGTQTVAFIPGGINMSKRKVYEEVGLQDESLFMYGDEVDWDIRVAKAGYKLCVTKGSIAWHQHIFTGKHKYRSDLAYFLINRNSILLAHKYMGKGKAVQMGLKEFVINAKSVAGMLARGYFKKAWFFLLGILYGIMNSTVIPKTLLKK